MELKDFVLENQKVIDLVKDRTGGNTQVDMYYGTLDYATARFHSILIKLSQDRILEQKHNVDLVECLCMQHAGAHRFQVHAGASQRMLNKCWRIKLYPSASGRMILTTSAVLCYTRPCSVLVCHDFMPCFTEPDCCTIPYHLTSHLPLLLLLPLLFQRVVR